MQILALQIDRPYIRAAFLKKRRGGFKIFALKSALLRDPTNVKRLYIPKFRGRFVTGLSSKDLMFRPMEFNLANTRHLEAALLFQSEGASHLDPSDTISIPHSIKKESGKVEALLITVPKPSLRRHLEEFHKVGVDPDCVSANALGLTHYVLWKVPTLKDAFLVDLGSSEWTCVLLTQGELKKTHALEFGTNELQTALLEDGSKEIDLQNPENAKLSHLRQELAKVIFSFHRTSQDLPIVFTGCADAFGNLKSYLFKGLESAVTKELNIGSPPGESKFAIPIGLALSQAKRPLQLLRNEFFPKKTYARTGSYALLLLFLSLSLTSLLFYFGTRQIHERKREMIEAVQPLMEMWDPQLKNFPINSALLSWKKAIACYGKEYPYILDVPKASQVLSWLSNHPLFVEFKLEDDPFELLDFRYQLESFPNLKSPQNRYAAKVDLQFRLKSPMHARKFHEVLLKGDFLVDSSKEIAWEAMDESYRTTFYLKPIKSPYVP